MEEVVENPLATYRFHCGQCGKGLKKKSHLDEHMMMHQDLKPFVCNNCGKGFRRNDKLRRHLNDCIENSSNISVTVEETPEDEEDEDNTSTAVHSSVCMDCGHIFDDFGKFEIHKNQGCVQSETFEVNFDLVNVNYEVKTEEVIIETEEVHHAVNEDGTIETMEEVTSDNYVITNQDSPETTPSQILGFDDQAASNNVGDHDYIKPGGVSDNIVTSATRVIQSMDKFYIETVGVSPEPEEIVTDDCYTTTTTTRIVTCNDNIEEEEIVTQLPAPVFSDIRWGSLKTNLLTLIKFLLWLINDQFCIYTH